VLRQLLERSPIRIPRRAGSCGGGGGCGGGGAGGGGGSVITAGVASGDGGDRLDADGWCPGGGRRERRAAGGGGRVVGVVGERSATCELPQDAARALALPLAQPTGRTVESEDEALCDAARQRRL
jgi:hypothetical protein